MIVPHEAGGRDEGLIVGWHGVRYQTAHVRRAVEFYTHHLGFKVDHQELPAFAAISLGELKLLLSGPEASGSRPTPDGRQQEPGGWNRIVLRVNDLTRVIQTLKQAGLQSNRALRAGRAAALCPAGIAPGLTDAANLGHCGPEPWLRRRPAPPRCMSI